MAAGVCFLLFVGVLRFLFGPWIWLGVILLPVLLGLVVLIVLPKGPCRERIIDWGFRHLDIGDFMERLDDRHSAKDTRPALI